MSRNRSAWILQIILFVAFLFFGIAKFLVSPEQSTDVFGEIGGSATQYITGVYQVISAILVIIPSTAFIGALLILVSMVIVVLLHIFIIGFAGPFLVLTFVAIILAILAVFVMKKRRKDLFVRKK